MSQNASGESAAQNPPVSVPPASNAETGGASSAPIEGVGLPAQGVSAVSGILDLTAEQSKAYVGFDPALHAVGADGKPLMRKGGGGYQLKRGRKKVDPSAPTAPRVSTIRTAEAPSENDVRISNEQAATMLCGMVVGGAQQLLGPAWAVTDKNEKAGLVAATCAYLDATGGLDLTPGVGLLFSWGPYALARADDEETRSRLSRFGSWLKGVFRRGQK